MGTKAREIMQILPNQLLKTQPWIYQANQGEDMNEPSCVSKKVNLINFPIDWRDVVFCQLSFFFSKR
jgi:hypothetical protein